MGFRKARYIHNQKACKALVSEKVKEMSSYQMANYQAQEREERLWQ